ncbi:MAG: ABC transporter permease, partial [Melioribacteraceae bacterium]|nr:ABC transporter permease [Melioribacteraceae bacterium]
MFALILIMPVVQLIFLGYAANMDVVNVPTVIFDQDQTETSRQFLKKFSGSGYFEFVEQAV